MYRFIRSSVAILNNSVVFHIAKALLDATFREKGIFDDVMITSALHNNHEILKAILTRL